MRFTEPTVGDRRERSAFLFFPKTINRECRWLERAAWEEKYILDGWDGHRWQAKSWRPK